MYFRGQDIFFFRATVLGTLLCGNRSEQICAEQIRAEQDTEQTGLTAG